MSININKIIKKLKINKFLKKINKKIDKVVPSPPLKYKSRGGSQEAELQEFSKFETKLIDAVS